MEPTFRQSMNWLHTWAGVLLCGLLFVIFWMGTLSVFARPIDRWMMPMTRLELPIVPTVPIDSMAEKIQEAAREGASFWLVNFPTERDPFLRVAFRTPAGRFVKHYDPITYVELPDPGSWAGSGFLYPFHVNLHLKFANIGVWLVGFAGMAMLALLVSGVIVHRKIFADFFTFRANRQPRRLLLDLHNFSGVLGLPFHFMITLSGLIIFWATYFPANVDRTLLREFGNSYQRSKAGQSAASGSLDAIVAEARRMWNGDAPDYLVIHQPGDANAYVNVHRAPDHVEALGQSAYFDAVTGALLHERRSAPPVATAQRFIAGMHLMWFEHWPLRWIYFVLGLVGCVMIVTGYLFWLEARRKKHMQLGLRGVEVVEPLAIGCVTGILAATASFFVANRMLPLGVSMAGYERPVLEVWTFYLVWLASFLHAFFRPALAAWSEQCMAIAVLAFGAVTLNAITTGDHLGRSLTNRHLWSVASMDVLLLAGAAIACLAAIHLRNRI